MCVYQGAHAWASMGAHLSMNTHTCYTCGIICDGQQENRNYWKYTYVYMSLYYIVSTNVKCLYGNTSSIKCDSRDYINSGTSFSWGKLPSQDKEEELRRLIELPIHFTAPESVQEESALTIGNPQPLIPVLPLMVIIPTKMLWWLLASGFWLWCMPEHSWSLSQMAVLLSLGRETSLPMATICLLIREVGSLFSNRSFFS